MRSWKEVGTEKGEVLEQVEGRALQMRSMEGL